MFLCIICKDYFGNSAKVTLPQQKIQTPPPQIVFDRYMDVSKNRGKTPKMDGENNGKPY